MPNSKQTKQQSPTERIYSRQKEDNDKLSLAKKAKLAKACFKIFQRSI